MRIDSHTVTPPLFTPVCAAPCSHRRGWEVWKRAFVKQRVCGLFPPPPPLLPALTLPQSKMGQLRLAPSRGDGVRVFYESLYKENSKAPMAAKYMLDHGLLNDADAKKVRAYLQTEVKKEKKRKTEEKEVKAK